MKITPAEAREQGFAIDRHCYPWIAYKGARFSPREVAECWTDAEAKLLEFAPEDVKKDLLQ